MPHVNGQTNESYFMFLRRREGNMGNPANGGKFKVYYMLVVAYMYLCGQREARKKEHSNLKREIQLGPRENEKKGKKRRTKNTISKREVKANTDSDQEQKREKSKKKKKKQKKRKQKKSKFKPNVTLKRTKTVCTERKKENPFRIYSGVSNEGYMITLKNYPEKKRRNEKHVRSGQRLT